MIIIDLGQVQTSSTQTKILREKSDKYWNFLFRRYSIRSVRSPFNPVFIIKTPSLKLSLIKLKKFFKFRKKNYRKEAWINFFYKSIFHNYSLMKIYSQYLNLQNISRNSRLALQKESFISLMAQPQFSLPCLVFRATFKKVKPKFGI